MPELNAQELEKRFTLKQLQAYNCKLRSDYNAIQLEKNRLIKKQESIIKKEVEIRTKEYQEQLKEKNKVIEDKDKQIEALKTKIAHMQSQLDNDASNSGISTAKTPIGKKKFIPNTREKSDKNKGGQKGHKRNKLIPFPREEATEKIQILPLECSKCHSKNLKELPSSIEKQELDYEIIVVKRINEFVNCKCMNCGNVFHASIPNDLKEEIQYGKTLQSLAICLTNDIYTPFNKTAKLISGLTKGEISPSEGYLTKLQKRASSLLESFIKEAKEHIINSSVYGWDDGVVTINQKEGILRTYCTDEVALFIGHEKKNEASLDEDEILKNSKKKTIVMHDHILHNYNNKYQFDNVECVIHLIRRLRKMKNNTNHDWNDEMVQFLSKTNKKRNKYIEEGKESFEKAYLEEIDKTYDSILEKAETQNGEDIAKNYYKKEEANFIKDLKKYKRNYLLWAYKFYLPSTNNACERNIRPVKSKMKISGQFQSLSYVQYYATIRSYIETCKKHGINIIEACVRLMDGNPYSLKEILPEKND